MAYRTLDKDRIAETAALLERRIGERFPDSSLRKVAKEVVELAGDVGRQAADLEKPILWLRILTVLTIGAAASIFVLVGTVLSFDRISTGAFDFVQGLEAFLNTAVFAGVGFWTLVTLEERFKRKRALDGLHALRSVIHIIDMHQLTKDPAVLLQGFIPTPSSPARRLSRPELTRYLDYCSEMLSITGKLAALYAQALNDDVVVNAVNDIENLGTNLSRKIWQKIMLVGEETIRPAA